MTCQSSNFISTEDTLNQRQICYLQKLKILPLIPEWKVLPKQFATLNNDGVIFPTVDGWDVMGIKNKEEIFMLAINMASIDFNLYKSIFDDSTATDKEIGEMIKSDAITMISKRIASGCNEEKLIYGFSLYDEVSDVFTRPYTDSELIWGVDVAMRYVIAQMTKYEMTIDGEIQNAKNKLDELKTLGKRIQLTPEDKESLAVLGRAILGCVTSSSLSIKAYTAGQQMGSWCRKIRSLISNFFSIQRWEELKTNAAKIDKDYASGDEIRKTAASTWGRKALKVVDTLTPVRLDTNEKISLKV